MTVLIFEDNLLWSARLVKSLKALGHDPVVRTTPDTDPAGATWAIVNLGSEKLRADFLVPALKASGVRTIGHAGHKESEVLAYGKDSGCDVVATNSQLTFKLAELIV
jgi:hypothetical protein